MRFLLGVKLEDQVGGSVFEPCEGFMVQYLRINFSALYEQDGRDGC